MGCSQFVDFLVVNCKDVIDEATIHCVSWTEDATSSCASWADEGKYECSQWADEGYYKCDKWADEGHNECSGWSKKHCHWYSPWNCVAGWFCDGYYWVANKICKASYWVANQVCQGWYWAANVVCKVTMWLFSWTCKIFGWLLKTVCTYVSWSAKLFCAILNWIKCSALALIRAVLALFSKTAPKPAVDHVFLLMLENRSYDHLLGFADIQATDAVTGEVRMADGLTGKTFTNFDEEAKKFLILSDGAPFQLPLDHDDPPHEFENVLVQLAGPDVAFDPDLPYPTPVNSGFVASYNASRAENPGTVSPVTTQFACFSHDPQDRSAGSLPVFATLAQEFCVCDRWFSSLPGPTWPNRFFALAASSGGLDHSPATFDGIISSTTVDGYRFENGNIFDLLDDNCYDWEIFEGDEFPISLAMNGMNLNVLRNKFTNMSKFHKRVGKADYSPRFTFIEPQYGEGDFSALGGFSDNFRCGNSMHPLNDVTRGERLIKQVYEALRASPIWERSVLIVTFDEHGGFPDHVEPPIGVPPGDVQTPAYVEHGFKFDRLGVRVPTLIISPLIPKNRVDGTTYDHTSTLATLERLLGMNPMTRRDEQAADFLHLFSLKEPRADTPETLPDPAFSGIKCKGDADTTGETQQNLQASREYLSDMQNRETALLAGRTITSMQSGFALVAVRRLALQQGPLEKAAWRERLASLQSERDFMLFMTDAKLRLRFDVRPPWLTTRADGPRIRVDQR